MPSGIFPRTKEHNDNMRKSKKGKKNPFWNKEHKEELGKRMSKLKGKKNNNFRGGKIIDKGGYIRILNPYNENKPGRSGYILEHRYIMEQKLGRKLRTDELIHHKDGNQQNNDIDNLYLTTIGKHPLGYGMAYQDGYKKGYIVGFINALKIKKETGGRQLP